MQNSITMGGMNRKAYRTELGPKFSEGSRLLWEAMEQNGLTLEDVTRRLNAKRGMAAHWAYGDIGPSARWAWALWEAYKIPIPAWNQAPTELFVPPAARETESPDDTCRFVCICDCQSTGTEAA